MLEEVCSLGRDPKYVCWKTNSTNKPENGPASAENPAETANGASNEAGGSSDEEEDDEEGGGKIFKIFIL